MLGYVLYTSAGVAFDLMWFVRMGSSKAMTARSPTDRMVSTTKREADGFQWSERSEDI